MSPEPTSERPIGVYLVALYFVLAGFLESIQRYRDWGEITANPIGEHSIWELAVNTLIYLAGAYLIWNFAALGRLAALVYGYLVLATYLGSAVLLYFYEGQASPLFLSLAVFHVTALIPVLVYLQPAKQKDLFRVSLMELLTSSD